MSESLVRYGPFFLFGASIIGVAATSIGLEALNNCSCSKTLPRREQNTQFLRVITGGEVLALVISMIVIGKTFIKV